MALTQTYRAYSLQCARDEKERRIEFCQRRGDFAAIVTLIIIYVVAPVILNGVGLGSFTFILIPQNPEQATWASVVAAWAAAGVMWSLAFSRAAIEPKGEPGAA